MAHIKQLQPLGNSRAVILDRVLLKQVDIDPNGEVEVSVQGNAIVITAHRYATDEEFRRSADRVFTKRAKMFRELAK